MKQVLPSKQLTNAASISLACLFQVLTACCIFFACLNFSPLLAMIGTIVTAPAIIRTGYAAELHLRAGKRFSWPQRIHCFLESGVIVLLTLLFAVIASSLISLLFGAFAVGFSMLYGVTDSLMDIAVVGTAGGMVWGLAGAILAIGATSKIWKINSHHRNQASTESR
jgi:hypothetical protein